MNFDANKLDKAARLTMLRLNEAEKSKLAQDIEATLELFNQMKAINTDDVEPLAHPLDIFANLRKDEVSEQENRELYMSCAESKDTDYYLAPLVIE